MKNSYLKIDWSIIISYLRPYIYAKNNYFIIKQLLENICLLVFDRNTYNHTTVCNLSLFDRNTWYTNLIKK